MKRTLISILLGLVACTNRQKPGGNSIADTSIALVTPTTKADVVDTSYLPLSLKIDGLNAITIKRDYYNPKDYNFYHQTFYLNGEKVFTDTSNYLVDNSKYSRVISENGNILLFMECDGRPNLDYLSAYAIDVKKRKIIYLASSVFDSNSKSRTKPFTDIDGDGFLEYGGFDLTEMHPNPDSMYYHPSSFYEIRNGKLYFDSLLTKREDIKANGVFIKNKIDTTIKRPKK